MKKITLKQYVEKMGSQESAAHGIGVSFKTVNRWLKGHEEPRGLSLRRLEDMGIMVR